ncbi:hypothetical protein MSG28_005335 [Choristoneura fumiferana]|uniref:Uncharacterized protein n=1 Tax=Choristoneura fumiferana TaxID=7141 RepID=A0ACC0JQU6_CHOFU|nr:hypothetical protein MSG28_005335 [Choristoneura fumiferana]
MCTDTKSMIAYHVLVIPCSSLIVETVTTPAPVPAIYELDATDLSEWDTQVKGKAIHIIQSYLNQDPCPFYLARSRPKEDEAKPNPFGKHHCEVCQKIIIGDNEMKIHLNSNKHKKTLQRRKLEENTETIHRSKDN